MEPQPRRPAGAGGRPTAPTPTLGATASSSSSSSGVGSWSAWLSAHLGLLGAAAAGLTAAGVAALWWRRRRAMRARAAAAAAAAASSNPSALSPSSRRGRAPRRSVPPAHPEAAAAAAAAHSNALPAPAAAAVASPADNRSGRAAASPAALRIPASHSAQRSPARSPASAALPSFAQLMASPRGVAASSAASSQPSEHSGDAESAEGDVLKPEPEMPASPSASSRPRSPPPGFFAQVLAPPPSRAHSSTALVHASTPMLNRRFGTPRQAIRLNFGNSDDSSHSSHSSSPASPGRRVLEVLCVVMLVLVAMVLMQDARWLAPISPALLYCMFTVAQERSRMEDEEDLLALDDTPRHPASASSSSSAVPSLAAPRSAVAHRVARNHPPSQGLSLFGYSVRVPTPSRTPSGRLQGRLPVASARGPLRPSTAMPSMAAASSSSSATPHRHQASDSRSGAIPFPSLVSPPAAAAAAASAMSTSPRSPGRNLHGSSGLVLQQPRPQRTVSGDTSVLARSFSLQDDSVFSPVLDRVDSDTDQSSSDSNQSKSPRRHQEEHKEQHAVVNRVRSPRSDPLVAPASQSRSAPLAVQLPARKIDVHAALSRMHHAPPVAAAAAQPKPTLAHSSSDLSVSSAGHTSASDSEVPTDEEVSFFNGHSRRDSALSLDSLPRSAATAASFRLHFNFAYSFEEVMRAFWSLGEDEDSMGTSTAGAASTGAGTGTEEEGEDAHSDSNTPPYTPTKITPSHSYAHLPSPAAMGSPIEQAPPASRGHHSSSSQSQLSALDLEVDTISDTGEQLSPASAAAAAAASASSSSSAAASAGGVPLRYAVRRVSTPLRLPLVLRKLLGTGRRWVMEDRIVCDAARRLVKLQSQSRVLEPFLSLVSSQTIAPHPLNPAHTRWSCEIKLHVYSSCGLLRGDVVSWISSMSKQRQHQISLLLSASIKRQVQRDRQAELAAQLAQLAQQSGELEGTLISPIIRHRSVARRQDSGARHPSAGSMAQMHAAAANAQQHNNNRRG